MNRLTIGLFAHVDAGKTTFAEQLLYSTNSIRQRGRVDHRDAYLDSHEIERARGITVFADQAVMTLGTDTYYLIDTPGHADFTPEMERAIAVIDYAVIIVSAVEGVQGHTETVWQMLRAQGKAVFFFINKTDRQGADVQRTVQEIRRQLTRDVHFLSSWEEGVLPTQIPEWLAECDEAWLEAYLEGQGDETYWRQAWQQAVEAGLIYPCMCGSALQDHGIRELLVCLQQSVKSAYDPKAKFGGQVYKVRYDDKQVRHTYVKVRSGTLRVRDVIEYEHNGQMRQEKITRLFIVNGAQKIPVDQVVAGDLCAVVGLGEAHTGEGLGEYRVKWVSASEPALQASASFDPSLSNQQVLGVFLTLQAEDPSLHVVWEEQVAQIHIRVMGVIQLEVLTQLIPTRFGFAVTFGPPSILYRETIASPVIGYGHFEPLRHYAEVHLRLEPGARGSGLQFHSQCHPDLLAMQYQHLVESHLFEREHHGLLTGMPITDLRVTLLAGAAHAEHTHGGDFREATFRALRQGLEKAENVLLEPYYRFTIRVSNTEVGRVLSDIQRAHGMFDPPQTVDDQHVITGFAPVATFMNYGAEFASITHGRGSMRCVFAGYDRCHNPEEVIARVGYIKEADPQYTSSSIFCAKGAGYAVAWDEAEQKMHLL